MQGTGVNQEESPDPSREAGAKLAAGVSHRLGTDLHRGGDADTMLSPPPGGENLPLSCVGFILPLFCFFVWFVFCFCFFFDTMKC